MTTPSQRRPRKRAPAAKPAETGSPAAATPAPDPDTGAQTARAIGRVVVFGGSGFVGREVIRKLMDAGMTVRVASRHRRGEGAGPEHVQADIHDARAVERALEGTDAAVNLVGILYEKGRQTFAAVHEEGAGTIARAARKMGLRRLVHMSALGASADSRSRYARSKAAGERAVREAFPDATVIRPSIVFGPDDDFFNKFAGMSRMSPALPLVGGGETRFQPVYVGDVAAAFVAALQDGGQDEGHSGKTYELGGPQVYTFRELLELMMRETGRKRLLVPLPFAVAQFEARFLEALPKPPLTRDQVELLKQDNVVGGHEPTLKDLGIAPTALETVLPTYLR
jgi:NADH dehydrogenase